MTRDEAMRVLADWRPGISDDSPRIAEALALAAEDAELEQWFRRVREWHGEVRETLRGVEPPPGLRRRILEGQKELAIPFWRTFRWTLVAPAAAMVLLLALVVSGLRPDREDMTFAGYRDRMVGFAIREYRMDILTRDAGEVRSYLEGRGAISDFEIPRELASLRVLGGARLSWQGHPVSMICFSPGTKDILYLFVVESRTVPEGPQLAESPDVAEVKRLLTASWHSGGRTYLLAGPVTEQEMRRLAGG